MRPFGKLRSFIGASPFVWLAVAISALFWFGDSLLDAVVFERTGYTDELIPEDPKELWMRCIIVLILLIFGLYAQHTFHRLRRNEERLRLSARVFQGAGEGIIITDHDNNIVEVNRAFERITGYTKDQVVGRLPSFLKSDRHDDAFYERMWTSLEINGSWEGEVWDKRQTGEVYPSWLSITVLRDKAGGPSNYIGIFRDISHIKETEQKLAQLAHYDPLTGLANRSLLHDRLHQALSLAKRNQWGVGIVFLDLDHFKDVNDSLGHAVGDRLLQVTATRLRSVLRGSDTIARHGGDEFVLVLENVSGITDVTHIVSKVRDVCGRAIPLGTQEVFATLSIGISLFPTDGETADELLKHADTAMYCAKTLGRDNFQFYSMDMKEHPSRRLQLGAALRRAVENQEFDLHYQPQIDLKSGRLHGVEALVRWHDPELGPVGPAEFIPVCEDSGLIHALDEWVLRKACEQFRTWVDQGCAPPRIAVNLSAREFRANQIQGRLTDILAQTGMEPHRLELEITERVVLETDQTTLRVLNEIRALGTSFAIDDFGTRYSSLSYLKRVPINCLKVDKSFVQDIGSDEDDEAITKAIIAMAHGLGLCVIAEGVETPQQLEFLKSMGCDVAQGFHFYRPMPPEKIGQLLSEQKELLEPGTTPAVSLRAAKD